MCSMVITTLWGSGNQGILFWVFVPRLLICKHFLTNEKKELGPGGSKVIVTLWGSVNRGILSVCFPPLTLPPCTRGHGRSTPVAGHCLGPSHLCGTPSPGRHRHTRGRLQQQTRTHTCSLVQSRLSGRVIFNRK